MIWVFIKFFWILISVVPLSGGTVGFALVLGAVVGRTVGEFFHIYFGLQNIGKFAIAGAAAMTAGIF
jgi:hypothetical protein